MRYPAILVLVLWTGAAPRAAAELTIESLNRWKIVVSGDAVPSERFAAEEFQTFYARATGHELPLVQTVPPAAGDHIYIGASPAMAASPVGFRVTSMGPEDLRIVIRDTHIAIAGGNPRGTLYGVYTFLEDYLGIRFLTVDHTHVPPARPGTVIPTVDRSYHPPLSYRHPAYQVNSQNPTFAVRLRCNTVTGALYLGGTSATRLAGHSFYRQVPWNQYSKTFPEYFGIRNGITITKQHEAQLCLTNPDVLEIVSKAVLDELAAHPDQRSIAVSQNDGGYKCACSKCEAIDRREESGAGTLLLFVNAVAERVAKKHPDVMVGTLAYKYSQKPPRTIRARANVAIQLTTHDCSITDPIETSDYPASVTFRRDLADWGRVCKRINLWYYNTNFSMYHMPIPNMHLLGPNLRYFVDHDVTGVFAQSVFNAPHAGLNDLMNYLTGRLLWDPGADSDALMDEFLRLHYGAAAPSIRDFIDRMHAAAAEQGIQHGWVGHAHHYGIDPALARLGVEIFDRAIRQAPDATIRSRLEKASIGLHMAALSESLRWIWPPGEEKVAPEVALRTRPHFRKFFTLCKKYGITHWEEATTNKTMRQYLKVGFGLKPDQPW